ncbi:MAG: twin-arginine translocation signal domain-containing protein [Gammaproteobacteria bacterium]
MSEKVLGETRNRREFLKGLATVGGATALAAVSGTAVAAQPPIDARAEKPRAEGYHVTPHVRTYYDKARM